MITIEKIQAYEKNDLAGIAPALTAEDIRQLVDWLAEKDDDIRYKSFLLLQSRSQSCGDVYPYWDVLVEKFSSSNSYQRSIGLMLIAENARWDECGRFDALMERYLSFCDDEKPITARQCIQSLCKIVPHKVHLHSKIVDKLISIDLLERKETQRKLLLLDILSVLTLIQKTQDDERVSRYIQNAMTGGLLDEKSKRMLASL